MIVALTPGLIAFGFCIAILPLLRREYVAVRSLMVAIVLLLLARYFGWRITSTIPPVGWTADFIVGCLFLIVEAASLAGGALSLMFLSRTIDRKPEVEANKQWLAGRHAPLIDVFICTFNEEKSILERTIIGATGMSYPNYRVWVLDDGRRDWLEKLANQLGCRYLTRPDTSTPRPETSITLCGMWRGSPTLLNSFQSSMPISSPCPNFLPARRACSAIRAWAWCKRLSISSMRIRSKPIWPRPRSGRTSSASSSIF
jgi:cellulose synthase/poly-beta-1,6-N-acetylglucosamine synthase-like glycosyltransferase